jgi:hypothetical protein
MSIMGLLNVTITITVIVVSNLAALILTETLTTSKTALGQVPPEPSVPGGDPITDNQLPNIGDQPEPTQSATPTNLSSPTIQITSHEDGTQVPPGELTIRGTSSDNEESNCQVYADVNDITPLQNATAAGSSGIGDYSQWTFTYTQSYQFITEGANELTAKISCFDSAATTPLSEWHSVNVTGVAGSITPTSTMGQAPRTDDVLVAEQGPIISSPPITSLAPPLSASEEPSGNSGPSQVEGGDDNSGDDDDGGEGDDDDGGEGDDDDGGEED